VGATVGPLLTPSWHPLAAPRGSILWRHRGATVGPLLTLVAPRGSTLWRHRGSQIVTEHALNSDGIVSKIVAEEDNYFSIRSILSFVGGAPRLSRHLILEFDTRCLRHRGATVGPLLTIVDGAPWQGRPFSIQPPLPLISAHIARRTIQHPAAPSADQRS
jgi:hypothetical protein